MNTRPKLERLDPFLGTWDTTICIRGSDGTTTTHHLTDTYRRALGKQFVFHEVDGEMAGEQVETLEIISEAEGGRFDCRSYDRSGSVGDFEAQLDGQRWIIRGESMRFEGEFSQDWQRLSGRWEQKRESKWQPWMEIVLNKREPKQ